MSFDNVEKLSISVFGLSREILEGWASVCCVHVFLVIHNINKINNRIVFCCIHLYIHTEKPVLSGHPWGIV